MTPEQFEKAAQVFREARSCEGAVRAALLDGACSGDDALRAEIERMLAADGAFPADAAPTASAEAWSSSNAPAAAIPTRVGRYRVKQLLAEGGMGRVYLAVQEQPRRTVALKLMKPGIASRSALRRFEYESQILARLRHPNIAQVYEAGTHDDGAGGVPFFAMEYVPNPKTLTEYASAKQLPISDRLELFAKVCDAVHHGHQKGVIHRDLKPQNVLVDAEGEPKIIDFGVARSTDSDLAVTTLQTDVGQLIGTLQYMSPEQCDADPHDIDTRSDVYTLGVILYELLCGQLPYEVTREAIHEAARVIREQAPVRPSTIDRALRGDLETVTLKAIEKDRGRRYRSASDLADDVRRYLRSEPIEARPPSPLYRLILFVRRNPTQVVIAVVLALLVVGAVNIGVGAVLVLVSLLAGGAAVIWQMYRIARAQRTRAEEARIEAEAARRAEEEQRASAESARDEALRAMEQAETQRDTAEAVTRYLAGMLSAARPEERGRNLTVRELLAGASEDVGSAFADRPLVEARLRQTIGNTHFALGDLALAARHLSGAHDIRERELSNEHPDALTSTIDLGVLRWKQGHLADAESLTSNALDRAQAGLPDDHPIVSRAMNASANVRSSLGRYREAEAMFRRALELRTRSLGEEHADTVGTLGNLANLLARQGQFREAEAILERVQSVRNRVLGPDHWFTLRAAAMLGRLRGQRGRHAAAEQQLTSVLADHERVLGPDHPDTLDTMHDLAVVKLERGRMDEAEALSRDVVSRRTALLGPTHPDTLRSMLSRANLLSSAGRFEEADELQSETLRLRRDVLGDTHPDTLDSINNLAVIADHRGQYARAEALALEALEKYKSELGEEHPSTLSCTDTLGRVYEHTGRLRQAEELYRGVLETNRRVLGPEHPHTLLAANMLATQLTNLGRYDEAHSLFETALSTLQRVAGEHAFTLWTSDNFAVLLRKQGRYAEAEAVARASLERRREVYGDAMAWTIKATGNLAVILQDQGRHDEAERLFLDALAGSERVHGPEHSFTLDARYRLAYFRTVQGRTAEAEDLHRQTLDARRRVLGAEHPDTLESMHGVATAIHRRGCSAEAEQLWREVLEIRTRVLGETHPETLRTMTNIAASMRVQGRYDEAEATGRRSLDIRQRALGETHPDTMDSTYLLATVLALRGQLDDAERMYRGLVETATRTLGPDHPKTLLFKGEGLADTLVRLGRFEEADALLVTTLQAQQQAFGPKFPGNLWLVESLASLRLGQGRYDDAIALLDRAIEDATAAWPAGHWYTGALRAARGKARTALRQYAGAETDLLAARALVEQFLGGDHERVGQITEAMVALEEARSGSGSPSEDLKAP